MREHWRKHGIGYLVAAAATAVALLVRVGLSPWLQEDSPTLLLVTALLVSSWYGGLRPGLLATGLCLLVATFFFLEPLYSFSIAGNSDRLRIALFLGIGIVISILSELRFQAFRRAIDGQSRLAEEVEKRQAAEASERRQHEQLRITLASIGDAVIATDVQGRVTFLNRVAQELTGWTHEDAQGRPLESVFQIVHEQTRQPVESPAERVLREGAIVGLGNHTVLISRDGSERPIDDSAAPIRDAEGTLLGVVLVFRDVMQQRRAENELRESEARKSAILETALDCIITMDHEGKVVEFNPAAERTFGYAREQVIGQELAELIIPASLREQHHEGMAAYLRGGAGRVMGRRIELPALRADGTEFPVELAITRIPSKGPPLFTAYLRDITQRKRAEDYRNARLAVTHVLAQAVTIQDAAAGVLRGICESLGWDAAFLWTINPEETVLICRESWCRPDPLITQFQEASRPRKFERDEGLPGYVWSTGKPAWILEVSRESNFPRAASAARSGLRSAFACPIVVGQQRHGVIEFFTSKLREPDPDLLEMMETVSSSFGHFIERRQAEDKLRRSERELADFFENATVGLHWAGPDGTILRANRAELEMLGYAPEEYIGRNIAEFHVEEEVIGDILQRLKREEKLQDYPARMRCKDGSIKDVLIHSSALFEEGRLVHTRCFTRDITDRKQAEEALQQSEARFRGLMEQAPFSVQIFAPDGRTIRVNRAWEELWGVRAEQIAGYNILEDRQLEARGVLHYIQQGFAGQPARIPAIQYDPNQTIPDITQHEDPRRWLAAVIYPLKDGDGHVREVVLIHEDITARKRAEDALRESRERLNLALQAADLGQWELSLDDHKATRNLRHDEIFGYESLLPEWTYEIFLEHVTPEDRELVDASFRKAVASGEAWDFECRILRRPDNTMRWIWAKGRVYQDDESDQRRMIGTVADITERKLIETELRETRGRLHAALEAGAIFTWTWDIPRNRLYTDRSMAQLFNLAPSEAEGGALEKFVQSIHRDDWPRVSAALDRSIQTGEEYEADYRIMRADGSMRWVVARGRAERDDAGRPVRMPGVLLDITERKRLEEELKVRVQELAEANHRKEELLALLDTLQRSAPVGFAFVDTNFRYIRINQALAAIDGNPPEYHLGRTVQETVPKLWPRLEPLYRRVLEEKVPVLNHEVTGETPAAPGRACHWLVSYYPVLVQQQVVGVGIVVTDITERKRLEDELRQQADQLAEADRRKDEFLATLAHELRNPLAPIRTGLELMKMAKEDVVAMQEIRDIMERQTQQLIALVDDLLDVSRITRGKLDLRKCRIKLADVVQSAVEASRPFIDEAGHDLVVAIPDHPIYLDADPHRLAQVFSNLLNNAAKYTPEGGRVWLTAERDGDDVRVAVKDDGIGIPADMLDRIFEMFAQIDRPMEKGYTGLGIGLTLVKSLVKMHGGQVDVKSGGPGQGSTFSVRLPILMQTPANERIPVPGDAPAAAANRRRVLVVDDNHAAAKMLSMIVKMLGHEVRTAGDGRQGIEIAASFLPDLVLMDIGMPNMNGYEAARQIRQQPWGKTMMLVALTGWGQDEDKQRTREAGFDHHLVKPADPAELQMLLAKLNGKPAQ